MSFRQESAEWICFLVYQVKEFPPNFRVLSIVKNRSSFQQFLARSYILKIHIALKWNTLKLTKGGSQYRLPALGIWNDIISNNFPGSYIYCILLILWTCVALTMPFWWQFSPPLSCIQLPVSAYQPLPRSLQFLAKPVVNGQPVLNIAVWHSHLRFQHPCPLLRATPSTA